MLAFFGNLAPTEVLVLAVVAVLVFGKRLPEVAGRGYSQVRRWRQSLDQLRRETGIDSELRNIERNVREASERAMVDEFAREEGAPQATVAHGEKPAAEQTGAELSAEPVTESEAEETPEPKA